MGTHIARARLLREIVIPAGTILTAAPRKTTRAPGHVEYLIGLTADCTATLTLDADSGDPQMEMWLEVLEGY